MKRLRLPDAMGRWCLTGAAAVAVGVAASRTSGLGWVVAVVVAGGGVSVARGRRSWVTVATLVLLGALAGYLEQARVVRTLEAEVAQGPARLIGRVIDDPRRSRGGTSLLLRPTDLMVRGAWTAWSGPTLLVGGVEEEVEAGETIMVMGTLVAEPGRAWGDPYAAVLAGRQITRVRGPDDPLFAAAAGIRMRVAAALAPWEGDSAGGLVAGFLIGETSGVAEIDQEALRLAGLSHYVAVSGSNVALFLTLWWVVAGPLSMGPRRRALAGLVGICLFVVVTRWEPSVLRASAMAGLVLVARAAGLPLSGWAALGVASGGLLLAAPQLLFDVGFQLSVLATMGVMAGSDLVRLGRWRTVSTALSVTVAAQIAVAPLLLLRFGSVPLAAPIANLLAAPAVAGSTMVAIIGVAFDWPLAMAVAVGQARWVLLVAEQAAAWPQLGSLAAGGVACLMCGLAIQRTRAAAAALIAMTLAGAVAVTVVGGPSVERPAVVFLDIGQGDAILVLGAGGETLLMDGGPDPLLLLRKLRRYDIERIDLMVLSHPHEDHLAGLVPVAEHYPVGMIWQPGYIDSGDTFGLLMEVAEREGIEVAVPDLGRHKLGLLTIDVLGPLRRYAHPNDQSLVLMVEEDRVLLPGDIETIAQRELGPLMADVMKVPHSGSITSDLGWLAASSPRVAVISVGPNSFGHPSLDVIEALEGVGSRVVRTDQSGDVVIPLAPESPP